MLEPARKELLDDANIDYYNIDTIIDSDENIRYNRLTKKQKEVYL